MAESLDDIRRIGDLESSDEAETATDAVLSVFAERITNGEAEDLAEQLPAPLADPLTGAEIGEAQSFPAREFVARVADRAGVDEETARRYTRAVLDAVGDAAPAEFARARDQLPEEYDRLVEAGTPMTAAEFCDVVAEQLEVDADAETVTTATLETLGERVSAGEAEDLATYLPAEFRSALLDPAPETPPAFPVEEFRTRVANRADLDETDAEAGAQAVLAVVADAAAEQELGAVRSQLPAEYDPLFERAETGDSG